MNFLNAINEISLNKSSEVKSKKLPENGEDFLSVLKESIEEVNKSQQEADKAATSIATGTVKDLHQAAIAIDKAEISMKMMLEVRNKALNAYKEILRTQV